ncbi:MAG: homocysteine S-methyltransferase family protein, partial [Muribaculaceae bacterium]|nr:homocysteine S-methyltransferase family protein [Muribaculaceae bacterium]
MKLSVRKLADGAYGTNLLRLSPTPDLLNLSDPQQVEALHDDYATAGSEILRTNT